MIKNPVSHPLYMNPVDYLARALVLFPLLYSVTIALGAWGVLYAISDYPTEVGNLQGYLRGFLTGSPILMLAMVQNLSLFKRARDQVRSVLGDDDIQLWEPPKPKTDQEIAESKSASFKELIGGLCLACIGLILTGVLSLVPETKDWLDSVHIITPGIPMMVLTVFGFILLTTSFLRLTNLAGNNR